MSTAPIYIHLPAVAAASFPAVDTFADLPDPTAHSNEIYIVLNSTGVWPTRKSRGFWRSNSIDWIYLGDFTPTYIRDLYESNTDVNRFSDAYRSKLDAAAAGEILIPMNCQMTDSVGDLVIPDTGADDSVVAISSNVYNGLVFGLIHDKPSPITCNVQVSGSFNGAAGLTRGLPVFVATDGKYTTTPPNTGNQQVLGRAFSSTRFVVDVALTKVVQ